MRLGKILSIMVVLSLPGCRAVGTCYPPMNVYVSEYDGKAVYTEAEYSRQVKVLEAQAKKDSALLEGEAEVIRATKLAEANRILGDSLRGREDYLRYLWIQNMHQQSGNIIYIPTEAGLPILEARPRR